MISNLSLKTTKSVLHNAWKYNLSIIMYSDKTVYEDHSQKYDMFLKWFLLQNLDGNNLSTEHRFNVFPHRKWGNV